MITNYTDGFVFPIRRIYLEEYKSIAEKVAQIWKEQGALEYHECIGEDLNMEGVLSFTEILKAQDDEVIVWGWTVFPSKEVRDMAHKNVPKDRRITELMALLTDPKRLIFDPSRMAYGGFHPFIQLSFQEK